MTFKKLSLGLSFIACLSATQSVQAQQQPLMELFMEYAASTEAKMQKKHAEFRLVREPTELPKREGATVPLDMSAYARGTVVTIHDRKTGAPLDSCVSPCALHAMEKEKLTLMRYYPGRRVEPMKIKAHRWAKMAPTLEAKLYSYQPKKKVAVQKCKELAQRIPDYDRDAELCLNAFPEMPRNFRHSGHCIVVFDVTPLGETTNIRADECTHDIFARPSIQSVSEKLYLPAIEYGEAVLRENIDTKVSFNFYMNGQHRKTVKGPVQSPRDFSRLKK